MRVFISYTVRDGQVTRQRLRTLASRLQDFCVPYVDLLEHNCGGHQPSVWRALANMDAYLLCITPAVHCSPWVEVEYKVAMYSGVPIYTLNFDHWASGRHAIRSSKALSFCRKDSTAAALSKTCHRSLDRRTVTTWHAETLPQKGAKTAHFCSIGCPHFCSMKIPEDVRNTPAENDLDEATAIDHGLEAKAREFQIAGNEVYATP